MKTANLFLITVTATGAALAVAALRDAQADTATKKKGWYTVAQANRGHQLYNNYCAECHMPDLTGAMGPALKGKRFLQRGERVP